MATTMPAGIPVGSKTNLPIVSEITSKNAPITTAIVKKS